MSLAGGASRSARAASPTARSRPAPSRRRSSAKSPASPRAAARGGSATASGSPAAAGRWTASTARTSRSNRPSETLDPGALRGRRRSSGCGRRRPTAKSTPGGLPVVWLDGRQGRRQRRVADLAHQRRRRPSGERFDRDREAGARGARDARRRGGDAIAHRDRARPRGLQNALRRALLARAARRRPGRRRRSRRRSIAIRTPTSRRARSSP